MGTGEMPTAVLKHKNKQIAQIEIKAKTNSSKVDAGSS
jgi:hypothetical protein